MEANSRNGWRGRSLLYRRLPCFRSVMSTFTCTSFHLSGSSFLSPNASWCQIDCQLRACSQCSVLWVWQRMQECCQMPTTGLITWHFVHDSFRQFFPLSKCFPECLVTTADRLSFYLILSSNYTHRAVALHDKNCCQDYLISIVASQLVTSPTRHTVNSSHSQLVT